MILSSQNYRFSSPSGRQRAFVHFPYPTNVFMMPEPQSVRNSWWVEDLPTGLITSAYGFPLTFCREDTAPGRLAQAWQHSQKVFLSSAVVAITVVGVGRGTDQPADPTPRYPIPIQSLWAGRLTPVALVTPSTTLRTGGVAV